MTHLTVWCFFFLFTSLKSCFRQVMNTLWVFFLLLFFPFLRTGLLSLHKHISFTFYSHHTFTHVILGCSINLNTIKIMSGSLRFEIYNEIYSENLNCKGGMIISINHESCCNYYFFKNWSERVLSFYLASSLSSVSRKYVHLHCEEWESENQILTVGATKEGLTPVTDVCYVTLSDCYCSSDVFPALWLMDTI